MADRTAERLIELSHVIEEGMTTYKGLPGDVNAGDTIFVANGSYLGFDVDNLHGTLGAPITIKAQGTGAVVTATIVAPTR